DRKAAECDDRRCDRPPRRTRGGGDGTGVERGRRSSRGGPERGDCGDLGREGTTPPSHAAVQRKSRRASPGLELRRFAGGGRGRGSVDVESRGRASGVRTAACVGPARAGDPSRVEPGWLGTGARWLDGACVPGTSSSLGKPPCLLRG